MKPSSNFINAVISDLQEISRWSSNAANSDHKEYRGKQTLAEDTITLNRAIWLLEVLRNDS